MGRVSAIEKLKPYPQGVRIAIASEVMGIVKVVLQANARELAGLPD
jgi:hypothetical protein